MTERKVAVVTGSGKKRIGWYVADALAQRGYDVAVHYRSSATEAAAAVESLKRHGGEVIGFQADLTDEKAVRGMVGAVLTAFGRIDVLVNCAAVWKRKRLEE